MTCLNLTNIICEEDNRLGLKRVYSKEKILVYLKHMIPNVIFICLETHSASNFIILHFSTKIISLFRDLSFWWEIWWARVTGVDIFTINYEGRKYHCTWNVYLDPTATSSYTLPELPVAVLERLPFLSELDNPTGLHLCGTQFSGPSTYREVSPQYFYNESDRFWQERIGYQRECVNIE